MDIKLPRLGEGADTGSVVKVLVKEGDELTKGQNILELENEKAVASIPSPAGGRVSKILVKEGDKLTVGQVILSLSENGAKPSTEEKPKDKPASHPVVREEPLTAREHRRTELPPGIPVAAAPSIRKMARDLDIDLSGVPGTERGGRITLEDLRNYIRSLQQGGQQSIQKVETSRSAAESIDFSKWGPVKKKAMTGLRKVISRQMTESFAIPHVSLFEEADITELMELRKKHQSHYEKKGTRLTVTPFILKAIIPALKKFPTLNSSLDEATQELILKEYYHIGIAVDIEGGLIVPVLKNVDRKSLLEISKELEDLATKTRERKVAADDLKGGTFTISNQGSFGGGHFTPIINKPEAAILGVGRGVLKPVVVDKKIAPRTMLPLSLTFDHRITDGADALRFIKEIIHGLENFSEKDVKL